MIRERVKLALMMGVGGDVGVVLKFSFVLQESFTRFVNLLDDHQYIYIIIKISQKEIIPAENNVASITRDMLLR